MAKSALICELEQCSIDWVVDSISAESLNVITILSRFTGINSPYVFRMWISSLATGRDIAASQPSGATNVFDGATILAIEPDTSIYTIVTGDDGNFRFSLTEAGAATFYVAIELPYGRLVVSEAITFA